MTKTHLILTSLVAAIPGGILTVILIMAFINSAENMSGMLIGLASLTLVGSTTAMLSPVGILIFTPKDDAPVETEESVKTEEEEDAEALDDDAFEDGDQGNEDDDGFDDAIPDDFASDDGDEVEDVFDEDDGFDDLDFDDD